MSQAWKSGDCIVIRTIANSDGTVVTATPGIVSEDSADVLAVYIPAGTIGKSNWIVPPEQRVAAVDSMPRSGLREYRDVELREQLRLYLPGEWFGVGLSFDTSQSVTSWYGNLEAPFVRTPIGIDTRDFTLDVIAYPDGTWKWKDEEEFRRRLEVGLDSRAHQNRVRAAGEAFLRRFERRSWPFDASPQQRWPRGDRALPALPAEWPFDYGTDKLLPKSLDSEAMISPDR